MLLNFKTYDEIMEMDYFQNEDNIKRDAMEYIEHKKKRDGKYTYHGYPSVTTVLDMMDPQGKIGLERWKNNLRKQGLDPEKISRNYADIGTAIHYAIGSRVSFPATLDPPSWSSDEYPDNCEEYIQNGLYMWSMLTSGERPALVIEKPKCEIYAKNEKYKYGGIYDLVATINGKYTIVDFKTSPSCKSKNLLQLGAYSMFFDKMPTQGMIINVCPDNRNPELLPKVTTLDEDGMEQARTGWIDMITAFHDIYDAYLPITADSLSKGAPLRNSLQKIESETN